MRCAPGTATLLTGPSGSGKSTVLRVLNGLANHLDHATITGEADLGGLDATTADLALLGQRVGTVFQNPRNQFFTATVVEELAFGRCNEGQDPQRILNAVEQAAERTQITSFLAMKIGELSGGQQQRVACGAAIAGGPEVVLLDEPTSNLAAEDIEALRRLLLDLKAAGTTLLIAEHRVYYLRDIVDQVAVLNQGQLTRVQTTQEFFAQSDAQRRAAGLRSLTRPVLTPAHDQARDRPGTTGVQLRNVRFGYGDRPVLNIDELDLPAGCVTALMGPCGAGKSTLARVVAGLATVERGGTVSMHGRPCRPRDLMSRSAMVMQDVYRQLFTVSVRDEVTAGTRCAESADPDSILAALDLEDYAHRHPMSLSGGQKQRVVIGAALAADADIYIFDEPTSGVDYHHLQAIAGLLRDLANRGVVVLVITHDAELVAACAQRVLTLSPIYDPDTRNHLTVTDVRPETRDVDAFQSAYPERTIT
ncbi:MAG: ABC transporter [Micrococcales bacterium]|nr:MAG: ABC transporter [Micrococcales bacterium]